MPQPGRLGHRLKDAAQLVAENEDLQACLFFLPGLVFCGLRALKQPAIAHFGPVAYLRTDEFNEFAEIFVRYGDDRGSIRPTFEQRGPGPPIEIPRTE